MPLRCLASLPSFTPRSPLLLLSAALALSLAACSKEEEVKPDLTPRLGLLELASSHRTGDPEPSGAARIEITQSEIVVDGVQALALEGGKVPVAERAGDELPKLKAKLAGKKSIAVSVYAAVPYATLGRALNTAVAAGVAEIAFKVRKPNASNQSGWLTLRNSRFVASADDAKFGESALLPWDSFAKTWDESLDACQSSTRADCGYKPMAKAEGGKLDMMLRVRGTGYALRFRQEGAPPAAATDAGVAADDKAEKADKKSKKKDRKKHGKSEMLDGIKAAPSAPEEAPPPPSTEHVFTLRTDQATIDPSPISGVTRPVCGAVACPVVLEPEGVSMSSQVIALLGAAFPDGTPAPNVAWVLPPKER
ncbi:MAG: hypothetical protein JWN48_216 [Myxococcaceae bacterium]|nr:hypothetical protein [Myxococcaceae bacterium]